MDKEQKIAFIQTQTICALAAIEGMKAENQQRWHTNESLAYTEADFLGVINEHGLSHNTVIEFFND